MEYRSKEVVVIHTANQEEDLWTTMVTQGQFLAHVHLDELVEQQLVLTLKNNMSRDILVTADAGVLLHEAGTKLGKERRVAMRLTADICLLRAGMRTLIRRHFKRISLNPEEYFSSIAISCIRFLEKDYDENEDAAVIYNKMFVQFDDMVAVLHALEERKVH